MPVPIAQRIGPPPQDADAVVVLLHGRTQTIGSIAEVAERIALPRLHWLLPQAAGNVWYPQSFLRPLDENQPALSQAIADIDAHVADLVAAGVGERRIVVAGYSQGACMTAELLVRRPRALGAAIVLTGGLIGPPGTTWPVPEAIRGVPVLVTGSTADPFVPAARGQQTARHLLRCGCAVATHIVIGRDHRITDAEIGAARGLLLRVAGRR